MTFSHFFHKIFEVFLAAILRHAFSIIHIFIFMTILFIKKLHMYACTRVYYIKGIVKK